MKQKIKFSKNLGNYIDKTKVDIYTYLIKRIINSDFSRDKFINIANKKLYTTIVEKNNLFPKTIQIKKYEFMSSMLESARRNLNKKFLSKNSANRLLETLVKYGFIGDKKNWEIKKNFKNKYGMYPPSFIVLSPTQKCNLSCIGCYASAKPNAPAPSLSYEIVDRIIGETYNIFGNRFLTISGGEPFMYCDNGKTLFDIWKKYSEMFFLVYTNGTLLNKENIKKLAELGNVIPVISVEGFEKETDEKRGKGIYKRILTTMKNLREEGVPFGLSVVATSKNIDILLSDKFYDYFFKEQGATHMWIFQIMLIGKARDMKKIMITPEQRIKLYRKWEKILKEKKYCVVDFWNSGPLTGGCLAYGRGWGCNRSGGYMYVDWNGNIMPCVFVPYYKDNIINLYNKGKGLPDALFSDFFIKGRKWQNEYGLSKPKKPKNWLMPCSIRDHYKNFKNNILPKNIQPEDEYAKEALESKEYDKTLKEFDKELKEKTEPIWKKEYLERDK